MSLSACASAPLPPAPVTRAAAPSPSLPDGAWVGVLRIASTAAADGEERVFMVLYACGKDVRYYLRNTVNGGFESPGPALSVESHHGTHHLRSFDWNRQKADDWVETQGLDVVEIDAKHARGWWTSTINNRDLPADHVRRTIHAHGIVDFKRHSSVCSREAKERVLDMIVVPFDPDDPQAPAGQ